MLNVSAIHATAEVLAQAHEDLVEAMKEAHEASEAVLTARIELKDSEQRILNDHAADAKKLGSNEETRKARVADLTNIERERLFNAERRERTAKGTEAICRQRVQAAQDDMRMWQILSRLAIAPGGEGQFFAETVEIAGVVAPEVAA